MTTDLFKRWRELEPLFSSEAVFEKARWLVPVYYYFLEFMAIGQFAVANAVGKADPSPFWPVFWLRFVPDAAIWAPYIFLPMLLIGATIGALFYRRRWARAFVFLAIFQFQSYLVSILGSEHEFYIPLFISFLFIFLPDAWTGKHSESTRKTFVLLFWAAQAYIFLVYFMSGFIKVLSALQQLGGSNYFSFDAAALYISFYLDQFQRTSLLGPFIIEHPLVGWFGLMCMLYITLSSAFVAFRPSLHRLWGLGLVFFHVGTLLSINLMFYHYPFFAALFLMGSPFAPEKNTVKQMLADLPFFGHLFRLAFRKESGIL